MKPICNKCNDTGKVEYREAGPGYDGIGHNLCECRRFATRVSGRAKWWSSEESYRDKAALILGHASVVVSTELPISGDNFPIVRDQENFYWPSMACVEVPDTSLTSGELRDIAAMLTRAADKIDEIDSRDSERAGVA